MLKVFFIFSYIERLILLFWISHGKTFWNQPNGIQSTLNKYFNENFNIHSNMKNIQYVSYIQFLKIMPLVWTPLWDLFHVLERCWFSITSCPMIYCDNNLLIKLALIIYLEDEEAIFCNGFWWILHLPAGRAHQFWRSCHDYQKQTVTHIRMEYNYSPTDWNLMLPVHYKCWKAMMESNVSILIFHI